MNEDFLQYVWEQRLFSPDLITQDGTRVEVLSPGTRNRSDGPDFFNARIQMDDVTWIGNVEIHERASDWFAHGHDMDKAYDNVILHVVNVADAMVRRPSGKEIPQVEMRVPDHVVQNYDALRRSTRFIPCARSLEHVDKVMLNAYLDRLVVERLRHKTETMERWLEESKGDWREAFYVFLARGLGFGVNANGMETLARSLPLNVLGKHKDNRLQVEALLLGQAGLIERFAEHAPLAADRLRMEYRYLSKKFTLQPIDASIWKYKTRPANSPVARIGILAELVTKMDGLLAHVIENPTLENIYGSFETRQEPSEHPLPAGRLGHQSIELLIINAIVPALFLYGRSRGKESLCDRAIELLTSLAPERNHVIRQWATWGVKAENAADSQALLELKNNYCERHDCLRCALSKYVFRMT